MRDKYIELVKEYIKEKPEYQTTLDEIKTNILSIGATEEEFDEAMRQVSGISSWSHIVTSTGEEKHPLPISYGKGGIFSFLMAAQGNFSGNKKISAVIVGLFLILLASVGPGILNKNKTSAPSTVANLNIQLPQKSNGIIPVVYANAKTVDPDALFPQGSESVKLTITGRPKKEVLGFFPYWMLSKQDMINLSTLTSISLFGLDVDGSGNIITKGDYQEGTGGWSMWSDPNLDKLIKRARAQNLKIYVTIKCFYNPDIENVVLSDKAQKNFIANAIYLVNSKNLDGVNIDFEYVGQPAEKVRDSFTRLITNLNSELKRQFPQSNLSIDTYLVSGSDQGLFNIPLLASQSNEFVIMGYDMHTPSGSAGPISAMGGDVNLIGYVSNYLEKVEPEKIILAVPYYGYDWPQSADGKAAPARTLPYAQIANQSASLKLSWNETSQTPYYIYNEGAVPRVVHFDNVRSLGIKYDYINNKDLKGVGIWALGYDGESTDLAKLLVDKFINQ